MRNYSFVCLCLEIITKCVIILLFVCLCLEIITKCVIILLFVCLCLEIITKCVIILLFVCLCLEIITKCVIVFCEGDGDAIMFAKVKYMRNIVPLQLDSSHQEADKTQSVHP